MVDFRKRLTKSVADKPLDPSAIYDGLDRRSDKGPLRPAQEAVLTEWHTSRRTQRDVIVKLHTGQGKTLIGLLMLQSKLNQSEGPALYLCPNKFLVGQTLRQAEQFGIRAVGVEDNGDLPTAFLDRGGHLGRPRSEAIQRVDEIWHSWGPLFQSALSFLMMHTLLC